MRCLRQICPSSSMRSKFVRKALQQARYVMMVPMWHRDIPGFLNQYQICQCVASVDCVRSTVEIFEAVPMPTAKVRFSLVLCARGNEC